MAIRSQAPTAPSEADTRAARRLETANAVIDELGGTKAVADLIGTWQQAVSAWRRNNRFPAHTYLILKSALEQIECAAPPELWGITPVDGVEPRPATAAEGGADFQSKSNLVFGAEPVAEGASASASAGQEAGSGAELHDRESQSVASSRVCASGMTGEGEHV